MIVTRQKDKINLDDLKKFNQEGIHNFLKYNGIDLYDELSLGSLNKGIKLSDISKGKYKRADVDKVLSGKGVSITFPANNRDYTSKDFIFTGKADDKYDKDYDIIVKVNSGVLEFPEIDGIYAPMACILPKYHKDVSWEFRFISPNYYHDPRPIISVPKNSKDWVSLLKAFTEFAVALKLFTGNWIKIFIVESKSESPNAKYFSSTGNEAWMSYIPTMLNAGYMFVGYPLIMGKLAETMTKANRGDIKPGLRDKLLNYCKNKYKDIYFVNLGTGSCFINPQYIDKKIINDLKKVADSKRLRTMLDWVLKGYEDKKYVIFYSDLDLSVALAHEVGHYLEDKDGTLAKIQKHDKSGIFSDGFIGFLGFLSGMATAATDSNKIAGWGEALGTVIGLLLKSPLLFSEFMASYKGIQVMKEMGCSEEDINMAKKFFRTAWSTYMASSGFIAAMGPTAGRITGLIMSSNRNY